MRLSYRRSIYAKVIFSAVFVTLIFCYLKLFNIHTSVADNDALPKPRKLVVSSAAAGEQYEKLIQADLLKQRPGFGDNGASVKLTGPEKEKGDQDLVRIALNEELSEHLSYNRTTPDARHPWCKTKHYDVDSLPTASVVIIFFNEPYSVVVRTVHSVLNTGSKNLKEVVLVDDCSTNEELKGKLDYYLETRFPASVRMIRLKSRMGLIRARLAGARSASGDILVFLDAHCECVQQWLEPLAERIKESRTSVLVPIIDVISATNYHYSSNGYSMFQIGGFTWNGHFDWVDIPKRERTRQKMECMEEHLEICPTNSPTMAGGLLAIDRNYFWEIGSYDEDMDGWGGENLEMSFRIWMCGGKIETIPCSRIGHIFREFHPYKFPDDKDTHGINTARLAEVWMDEYKELFYQNRPDLKNYPEVGNLSRRRALREKLKCKNFDWYMKNIYPEKFLPTSNVKAYGRVENAETGLCIDDLQQNRDQQIKLGVYFCHKEITTRSQFFSLTNEGLLRVEEGCATVEESSTEDKHVVKLVICTEKYEKENRWELNEFNQLRYVKLDLCLDCEGLKHSEYVYVTECHSRRKTQQWEIKH